MKVSTPQAPQITPIAPTGQLGVMPYRGIPPNIAPFAPVGNTPPILPPNHPLGLPPELNANTRPELNANTRPAPIGTGAGSPQIPGPDTQPTRYDPPPSPSTGKGLPIIPTKPPAANNTAVQLAAQTLGDAQVQNPTQGYDFNAPENQPYRSRSSATRRDPRGAAGGYGGGIGTGEGTGISNPYTPVGGDFGSPFGGFGDIGLPNYPVDPNYPSFPSLGNVDLNSLIAGNPALSNGNSIGLPPSIGFQGPAPKLGLNPGTTPPILPPLNNYYSNL